MGLFIWTTDIISHKDFVEQIHIHIILHAALMPKSLIRGGSESLPNLLAGGAGFWQQQFTSHQQVSIPTCRLEGLVFLSCRIAITLFQRRGCSAVEVADHVYPKLSSRC